MSPFIRAAALSMLAPLILAGCGTGSTEALTTNGFAVGVHLPTGETAVSVIAGGSTNTPVSLVRYGTFTGDVTFVAEGLPGDVSATFNPAVVPAGSTTTTMIVTAGATLPAGSTQFRLHATGVGGFDVQVMIPVVLTESEALQKSK